MFIVWECHFLSYCIWDENICPLIKGFRSIELAVDGGSTVFIHTGDVKLIVNTNMVKERRCFYTRLLKICKVPFAHRVMNPWVILLSSSYKFGEFM